MGNDETFAGNIERFSGFAAHYDGHRPSPPARLAALLKELAGIRDERARVVDLGCGTGLSTRYWIGKAARIIGVEPSDSMRNEAETRGVDGVSYRRGFSHDTGLPDACADIVFCSQALHWMDPQGTFKETARILRPGGVFAACDYDWPPVTGIWELDRAYLECDLKARGIEEQMGLKKVLNFHEKSGHLGRMEASGVFRWVREVLLHHDDEGDAERLVGLLSSQGGVQTLLKAGLSEEEMGIPPLRELAERMMPGARQWLWCSRIRVGVV